jgi:hypothetical protein
MSNELIIHQPVPAMIPYADIVQMGRVMAASKLFGIQNESQAVALMLLCQSENMHPAVAMRDFHIISGRPALKADAMLSRFKAVGGKVKWHDYTDTKVSATFTAPDGDSITLDWTPERVKKAQLSGNAMHGKYPRQMLKARCISEGIRAVYPGVLSGLYAPEEVREFTGPAETTGPDRPEPEPAAEPEPLFVPPGILAELAACQSTADCRVWVAQSRNKLGLTPKDPRYQELIALGKERAEQIEAAPPQSEPDPEPTPEPTHEPALEPDAGEPELEPDYQKFEAEVHA